MNGSFNILPRHPRVLNFWRLVRSNSRSRSKSYVQMPTYFFFIFFAQQPRLSTYWPIFKAYTSYIFSSKQFARKSELFARNVHLHILKIEHLYSTRKTQHFQFKLPTPARQGFPTPLGTDNGQMTVDGQEGRKGGGGGFPAKNWSAHQTYRSTITLGPFKSGTDVSLFSRRML